MCSGGEPLDRDQAVLFPLPLEKSGPSTGESWPVRGVASSPRTDAQGERLNFRGLDIEPLTQRGYFNWNHGRTPPAVRIGEVHKAQIARAGDIPGYKIPQGMRPSDYVLEVAGELYQHNPIAQQVWNDLCAVEKAASYRRAGYQMSVEGKVLAKSGGDLLRTKIYHVAVTHEPVNEDTWLTIAKSHAAAVQEELPDARIFRSFADFVKSIETEEVEALRLENLAGVRKRLDERRRKALALDTVCKGRRPCHDGERFIRGSEGLLHHLAICDGQDPDAAADHIIALIKALR